MLQSAATSASAIAVPALERCASSRVHLDDRSDHHLDEGQGGRLTTATTAAAAAAANDFLRVVGYNSKLRIHYNSKLRIHSIGQWVWCAIPDAC